MALYGCTAASAALGLALTQLQSANSSVCAGMQLCLVMDEVDGMSAGDRGGVPDLILTIKAAKLPIICICNDKYNQKLKSLRNHCLELDFRCLHCWQSRALHGGSTCQTLPTCSTGAVIQSCMVSDFILSCDVQEAHVTADLEAADTDLPEGGAAGEREHAGCPG